MKPFAELSTQEVREWCATEVMGWVYVKSTFGDRITYPCGSHVMFGNAWGPDTDRNQLRDLVVKVCNSHPDGYGEFVAQLAVIVKAPESHIMTFVVHAIYEQPLAVIEALYEMVEVRP